MRNIRDLLMLLFFGLMISSCSLALPGYNQPSQEKLSLVAAVPEEYSFSVESEPALAFPVAPDGKVIVEVPVLPRVCSRYFLGMRLTDGSVENRKVIKLLLGAKVVRKFSLNDLRTFPADAAGYREVRVR